MIKYTLAPDIDLQIRNIARRLKINHDFSRIVCVRSYGSKSKYVIARCHSLPRIMQFALNIKTHYVIEIISERFDKMSEEEKTKTLIHELMHIPKAFGGGFKYHNVVNKKNIDKLYKKMMTKVMC
ncbi:MAG: putative metallopeptidase [Candidatus Aenigmatarchaeota archaeon]